MDDTCGFNAHIFFRSQDEVSLAIRHDLVCGHMQMSLHVVMVKKIRLITLPFMSMIEYPSVSHVPPLLAFALLCLNLYPESRFCFRCTTVPHSKSCTRLINLYIASTAARKQSL
ncbi:hypothetical protein PsorP6_000810 [Peronosclerospora sorghi]|uniref:Uncharacterized protein n=1 Tax=Peronosclerospora sorghi TaxID=230839 RepID=A0ACC0WVN0_9STRA|nr:hypothetical protein PsorP6_000810 [Peronosclerospora sorghi]